MATKEIHDLEWHLYRIEELLEALTKNNSNNNSSNNSSSEEEPSHTTETPANTWNVISLTRAEYNDGADSHLRILDFNTGEVTLLDTNSEEFSDGEYMMNLISSNVHNIMKGDGSFIIINDFQLETGYVGAFLVNQHDFEANPHLPIDALYGNMSSGFDDATPRTLTIDDLNCNDIQFIFSGDFNENPSDEKNADDIVFTMMYK